MKRRKAEVWVEPTIMGDREAYPESDADYVVMIRGAQPSADEVRSCVREHLAGSKKVSRRAFVHYGFGAVVGAALVAGGWGLVGNKQKPTSQGTPSSNVYDKAVSNVEDPYEFLVRRVGEFETGDMYRDLTLYVWDNFESGNLTQSEMVELTQLWVAVENLPVPGNAGSRQERKDLRRLMIDFLGNYNDPDLIPFLEMYADDLEVKSVVIPALKRLRLKYGD